MNSIRYVQGNVCDLRHQPPGNTIITHVCNDIGGWGAGVVLAISNKWSEPETNYRQWAATAGYLGSTFGLGETQLVQVEPSVYVANMIGQHGTGWHNDIPPVRYDRIRQCLNTVAALALELDAEIAAPRFGAGLAGGSWQVIEGLIKETLGTKGLRITIYDL